MSDPDGPPAPLRAVVEAEREARAARAVLREAVTEARSQGHTWAEVGSVLGISRQAAFKRFGGPRDPRTGETMTAASTADLVALAEHLFARLDAGDYDALRRRMPDDIARVLTRRVVLDAWARAVADTGNLEACRGTRLELPDGTAVAEGDDVLGSVVARTELVCEAGSWEGQITFDDQRRVAGLLVVGPPRPAE